MDAAAALFCTHGYHGASMRDIARIAEHVDRAGGVQAKAKAGGVQE